MNLANETALVLDVATWIANKNSPAPVKAFAGATDPYLGAPRLSSADKQPKHIGFGFVIHLSGFDFAKVEESLLRSLAAKGMRMENSQPLFMKSRQPFIKVTFNRGDEESAKQALKIFQDNCATVYKNWL